MTRERTPASAASEEAALAWETFHGAELPSPAEHRKFGEWMLRSPENIEAYLRVSRTMHAVRTAGVRWPDTSEEELIAAAKAHLGSTVVTSLREAWPEQMQRAPRRRIARAPLALALAAMLLAVTGLAWFMMMAPQTFETRFGEQRFVRLDDGSGVTLNTATRIEVKLSKDHRVVRLVRGEALFDVAHDKARPFDVYTGNAILRAVGTRFNVDVRPDRTTVTVAEGVVSLTHGAPEALPLGNTLLLHVSDRVVVDSAGPGTPEHGVRLDEATAWTQQKLIFKNRLLGEVADEFNRYNRDRIVIETPHLREERITGVFKTTDSAPFLAFLANFPGVRIHRGANAAHVVTLDEESQ